MKISKMTLGTAQLGMEYGIANKVGKPDEESAFRILETAWSLGINSVDTAQAYGDSEKMIGSFMEKRNMRFFITTKIPSLTKRKIEVEELEKRIIEDVHRSLNDLKISRIDNLMLHDFQDILRFGDSLIRILEKILKDGLVGNLGVSVYSVDEAEKVMEFDVFTTIQIPFNIFNTEFYLSGTLEKLKSKGFTVFARSVFLQGLFFLKPSELPPSLSSVRIFIEKLRGISERYEMEVNELAIRFVLSHPLDSLVIGIERVEQLIEDFEIFQKGGLHEDILEKLTEEFKDVPCHVKDPRRWHI
ncbi:MAG TPA: aldo/keto reductase [Thermotogales bacterium]|nr:aldo/keto reductase [Thermotogales bacterium]